MNPLEVIEQLQTIEIKILKIKKDAQRDTLDNLEVTTTCSELYAYISLLKDQLSRELGN